MLPVFVRLQADHPQCPPAAEGQDAVKLQQTYSEMRRLYKKVKGDVQGLDPYKAIKALEKTGQHGLSYVHDNVRIHTYAGLIITRMCKADRQSCAALLGLAEPNELVDRLLGNLLPKHLDPWAHLKGEGAKKKGAKGDAAAQDQAEGGSTQDQDQAKAAAKGPAFPSYFHVLELFTCTLAHISEFVAAAAEYFLQRADLFGDRWKQAETLLLDCITDHNVEPDKRRLRAVPEDMVGVSWPAVPVPVPHRSKAMNRSWAQAQADRAAVAAAQQTAAGAQRGAAAAGSSGGVAAAAAGEDLVLVGVVPGQAAAAAGKRGAGSSQEEQQPAAAAAADAMGGPVAAPYGHGIGWHDKEVKKAPDYSGQLSRMITMTSRQPTLALMEERAWSVISDLPAPVQALFRRSMVQVLYAAQCVAPLASQELQDNIIAAAYPAAALLQHTKAAQAALLEQVKKLLQEFCPAASPCCRRRSTAGDQLAAAVDAVQEEADAAGGAEDKLVYTHLAELLEGYRQVNDDLETALRELRDVPDLQPTPTPGHDTGGSSAAAGGGSGSSFAPSSAASSWDWAHPELRKELRRAEYGASRLATSAKLPLISMESLVLCANLLAGGADNQCGLLQGYKLKDRPEGPGLLLKQFRVKVLTLQGEVITHADADSNYALSDVTGRPSMPIEEFLNELLVAAYAAGRNNALFPVEGITLVIERVQGHPWEGLSAEQQAAWHEAHPGVAAPGPLPEGGLVLVSLGLLVPYRGRDMGSLREELVKSPQFQALGLPEKRQLLGAVSRLLIRGFASVLQDLHKLGILHLDGKPSNVVFQPTVPRTGIPLLDILLDIQYGKATAVDAGTSYTLVPLVGKGGTIFQVATREPRGCTWFYAAYYIYAKMPAAAAPVAAGVAKEALPDVPPGSVAADFTMKADTHMMWMSWAEMVACVEEGVEGELVLELSDLASMPWNALPAGQTIPWKNAGFMKRLAQAAGQAAVDSTPNCREMGAMIKQGLCQETCGVPDDVHTFCSGYYDADIKLLDTYIQRWGGAAAAGPST